jgi:hypothetical protein
VGAIKLLLTTLSFSAIFEMFERECGDGTDSNFLVNIFTSTVKFLLPNMPPTQLESEIMGRSIQSLQGQTANALLEGLDEMHQQGRIIVI